MFYIEEWGVGGGGEDREFLLYRLTDTRTHRSTYRGVAHLKICDTVTVDSALATVKNLL
jgi:hypothetical protein